MGFEPEPDFVSNNGEHCGYADCEMGRAANALHSGCLKWLELALNDADLPSVIVKWGELPVAIRKAMLALVGSLD